MNWEKLCPNLSFTFEGEIRNLLREKLCRNLGFSVESKTCNLEERCSHFKLNIIIEIFQ